MNNFKCPSCNQSPFNEDGPSNGHPHPVAVGSTPSRLNNSAYVANSIGTYSTNPSDPPNKTDKLQKMFNEFIESQRSETSDIKKSLVIVQKLIMKHSQDVKERSETIKSLEDRQEALSAEDANVVHHEPAIKLVQESNQALRDRNDKLRYRINEMSKALPLKYENDKLLQENNDLTNRAKSLEIMLKPTRLRNPFNRTIEN